MNILFICRHNRFRSKVAEALFRKYTRKHDVQSAGIKLDIGFLYVALLVKKILKSYGVSHVEDLPQIVDGKLISWADRIIIVANNVDIGLFPKNKVEVWPVIDCDQDDEDCIKDRIANLDKLVKSFVLKIT